LQIFPSQPAKFFQDGISKDEAWRGVRLKNGMIPKEWMRREEKISAPLVFPCSRSFLAPLLDQFDVLLKFILDNNRKHPSTIAREPAKLR
jgi:hypothetical protein